MKIVTRTVAINNLKRYIGKDLRKLALEQGITTYETGKQNKGWKGLVLERLAGLETNVSKAPNGLTYELKSVAFHHVKDKLVPKETMAITMINPEELKTHSFFESHCWAKLKTIVFCAVEWNGTNSFIREKLITQGFKALTGADGKWIQARTKGPGHGSVSRAFYARTVLVKKIFEIAG